MMNEPIDFYHSYSTNFMKGLKLQRDCLQLLVIGIRNVKLVNYLLNVVIWCIVKGLAKVLAKNQQEKNRYVAYVLLLSMRCCCMSDYHCRKMLLLQPQIVRLIFGIELQKTFTFIVIHSQT